MLTIKNAPVHDLKLDDETGQVTALFATMGVIDKDGDVTLPGFFGTQEVAVAWAHDPARLVGKGAIREVGDNAIFDGKFFLDTIDGEQAYRTVKAMGDLQEWSYGFNILPGGYKAGQHEGQSVRFLQPLDDGTPGVKVAEVSPVLRGAGEGTMTVGIKAHGLRFVEQAEQTAQAVELLLGRAEEIQELRAEKGTDIGSEAVARLLEVKTRLQNAAEMFGMMTEPAVEEHDYAVEMLVARRHLADAAVLTAGR